MLLLALPNEECGTAAAGVQAGSALGHGALWSCGHIGGLQLAT